MISYFIKFDKELQPIRLVCKNWHELEYTVARLIEKYGEPFEWIIRDYHR